MVRLATSYLTNIIRRHCLSVLDGFHKLIRAFPSVFFPNIMVLYLHEPLQGNPPH